jgi:hypothetical protein
VLGWPNGSGGSLQSCYIWVQLPSPALHIEYIYFLRQHLREVTVPNYLKRLGRLSKIGNLDNPEKIKNIICTYQSTESYKELLAHSYDYYMKFKDLHGTSLISPEKRSQSFCLQKQSLMP